MPFHFSILLQFNLFVILKFFSHFKAFHLLPKYLDCCWDILHPFHRQPAWVSLHIPFLSTSIATLHLSASIWIHLFPATVELVHLLMLYCLLAFFLNWNRISLIILIWLLIIFLANERRILLVQVCFLNHPFVRWSRMLTFLSFTRNFQNIMLAQRNQSKFDWDPAQYSKIILISFWTRIIVSFFLRLVD